MTAPQWFSAIVGVTVAVVSVAVLATRKTLRFKAFFWFLVGCGLTLLAVRPQLIDLVGADSADLRLRFVVVLISFIVMTLTLEAIRVGRMQERYALLWLATGAVLLLGSAFPELTESATRLTGMSYDATVAVVLFVFVLLILFSFSVALSCLQFKLAQVARQLALATERLRRLERADAPPDAVGDTACGETTTPKDGNEPAC